MIFRIIIIKIYVLLILFALSSKTNAFDNEDTLKLQDFVDHTYHTNEIKYIGGIYNNVEQAFILNSQKFEKTLLLRFSKFNNTVNIERNHFSHVVILNTTIFGDYTNIMFNEFSDEFDFRYTTVDSMAQISMNTFEKETDISASRFNDQVYFISNVHKSKTKFDLTYFNNDVFFLKDEFSTYLSFNSCFFNDTVGFDLCILPDTLDFSNIHKIVSEIDFTKCILKNDNRCIINLLGTDISKIKINTSMFKIWFPPDDSATYEQKASVYENLLVKFKKDGFNDSYKDIDIEFRELKYQNAGLSTVNFLEKYWWNYGYNKERILFWSVALLLFFSGITSIFFNRLRNEIYIIDLVQKKNIRHNYFLRYYYSVIYTAVIFFGIKLNIKNFKTTNGWFVYIVFVYLTGLVCTAYIINLIVTK
jgi:hypothetical protein